MSGSSSSFGHLVIQSIDHSVILSLGHLVILSFSHSVISHSVIRSKQNVLFILAFWKSSIRINHQLFFGFTFNRCLHNFFHVVAIFRVYKMHKWFTLDDPSYSKVRSFRTLLNLYFLCLGFIQSFCGLPTFWCTIGTLAVKHDHNKIESIIWKKLILLSLFIKCTLLTKINFFCMKCYWGTWW